MSLPAGSAALEPGLSVPNNSSGAETPENAMGDASSPQGAAMPPTTPRTKHRIPRSMRPIRDEAASQWQTDASTGMPLAPITNAAGANGVVQSSMYEETTAAEKPAASAASNASDDFAVRNAQEALLQTEAIGSATGATAARSVSPSLQAQNAGASAYKMPKLALSPAISSPQRLSPDQPQDQKRQKHRGNRKRGKSDAAIRSNESDRTPEDAVDVNPKLTMTFGSDLRADDIVVGNQGDINVSHRRHQDRASRSFDITTNQKSAVSGPTQARISLNMPNSRQPHFAGQMPSSHLGMVPEYGTAGWDQRTQAMAEMMLQAQWQSMPWSNQSQLYRPGSFEDEHAAMQVMHPMMMPGRYSQSMMPAGFPGAQPNFFGFGFPQGMHNDNYAQSRMQQQLQLGSPSHPMAQSMSPEQQAQLPFIDSRVSFHMDDASNNPETSTQKSSGKRQHRKQKRSVTIGAATISNTGNTSDGLPLIAPQETKDDDSRSLGAPKGSIALPSIQPGGVMKQRQQPAMSGSSMPPLLLQSQPPALPDPLNAAQTVDQTSSTRGMANERTPEQLPSAVVVTGAVGNVESNLLTQTGNPTALSTQTQAIEPLVNYATHTHVDNPSNAENGFISSVAAPTPISSVSTAGEKERIATIHSLGILDSGDQPRLNKITQMTARLLGGTCCVLSIVDTDKAFWKSVFWSTGMLPIKEEARYESFCSWVVQDETGRGITILDARVDPRCVHMRVRPGLEFYAGVPLTTVDRKKIGALSIRGSTRTQFSVMDMNILHEMAFWATGELETISQKRELDSRETMLKAQLKLARMIEVSTNIEKIGAAGMVEKALGVIREALRASVVLLLRFGTENSSTKSVLYGYSTSPNMSVSLTIGDEIFYELSLMTLRKESVGTPLHLDSLMSGPVTKDVDHYLNKSIVQCTSELVWANNRPTGVVAAFFEGQYRFLSTQEIGFVSTSASMLSAILERVDLSDAFLQTHSFTRVLSQALKKHSSPFGQTQGLAPVLMLIEPMFPQVKGYAPVFDDKEDAGTGSSVAGFTTMMVSSIEQVSSKGPKGQAQAQVLAQLNDMESVIGSSPIKDREPVQVSSNAVPGTTVEIEKTTQPLTPVESVEIMSDFSQMLDVLADRLGMKRAKRCGNLFAILGNVGPDSGTPETIATFAHELFFTLDVYNRKTRRNIKARVGIHCDFVPSDFASESQILKDMWFNMVHFTYKLETMTDSTLVSDIFYHQTKEKCTYEQASPITVRGQGSFMTYRLIGMVLANTEAAAADSQSSTNNKDNGVNNGSSLITQKLVAGASNTQPSTGSGAGGKDSSGNGGGNNAVSGGGNAVNSTGSNGSGGNSTGANAAAVAGSLARDSSKAESDVKRSKKGSRAYRSKSTRCKQHAMTSVSASGQSAKEGRATTFPSAKIHPQAAPKPNSGNPGVCTAIATRADGMPAISRQTRAAASPDRSTSRAIKLPSARHSNGRVKEHEDRSTAVSSEASKPSEDTDGSKEHDRSHASVQDSDASRPNDKYAKLRPVTADPRMLSTSEDEDPFSYRHFNAHYPTANKLLSKKWEERSRYLHQQKLKDVRTTIDNTPPKVYPHLEMRLKKLKLEEDRLVDIKRKNQILLERIAFQMIKYSEVVRKSQLEMPAIRSYYSNEKRRRDNAIIASQNVEIFERIESKSPFYNRLEWLADRKRNLGYLKNISQYPKNYIRLLDQFNSDEDYSKFQKHNEGVSNRAQTAVPRKPHDLDLARRPMTAAALMTHNSGGFEAQSGISGSESQNAKHAS